MCVCVGVPVCVCVCQECDVALATANLPRLLVTMPWHPQFPGTARVIKAQQHSRRMTTHTWTDKGTLIHKLTDTQMWLTRKKQYCFIATRVVKGDWERDMARCPHKCTLLSATFHRGSQCSLSQPNGNHRFNCLIKSWAPKGPEDSGGG